MSDGMRDSHQRTILGGHKEFVGQPEPLSKPTSTLVEEFAKVVADDAHAASCGHGWPMDSREFKRLLKDLQDSPALKALIERAEKGRLYEFLEGSLNMPSLFPRDSEEYWTSIELNNKRISEALEDAARAASEER